MVFIFDHHNNNMVFEEIGTFFANTWEVIIATIIGGVISILIAGYLQNHFSAALNRIKTFTKSVRLKQVAGYVLLLLGFGCVYFGISSIAGSFITPIHNAIAVMLGMGSLIAAELLLMTGMFMAFPAFTDKWLENSRKTDERKRRAELEEVRATERAKELGRLDALEEHKKHSQ